MERFKYVVNLYFYNYSTFREGDNRDIKITQSFFLEKMAFSKADLNNLFTDKNIEQLLFLPVNAPTAGRRECL